MGTPKDPDYHRKYWERHKVERTCCVCGAMFYSVKPATTCSPACRGKLKSDHYTATYICEVCGKSFQRTKWEIAAGNNTTCSRGCWLVRHQRLIAGENHWNWQGGPRHVTCPICGKEFTTHKADRQFCSNDCRGKWLWRGGCVGYRGRNWRKQRRMALERDHYRCQDCGRTAIEEWAERGIELAVHHIRPYRLFDDYHKANALSNLITLCNICHIKHERALMTPKEEAG